MPIKHVSLDAWNTILIPSKEYARRRTNILANVFNCSGEFAKRVYTNIKHKFDEKAERDGEAFTVEYIYNELIAAFPNCDSQIGPDELCRSYFEPTFIENPPTILNETINAVNDLKSRGITVSIASNTNFISGRVLSKIIRRSNMIFDFMLFSDLMPPVSNEFGYKMPAKPNPAFFHMVQKYANVLHAEGIEKSEIVHIGDSDVCDFQGASKFGLQARLLKSVDELPALLMEI
jgi:FMN phosphatase YigB (HAD superfamily)